MRNVAEGMMLGVLRTARAGTVTRSAISHRQTWHSDAIGSLYIGDHTVSKDLSGCERGREKAAGEQHFER